MGKRGGAVARLALDVGRRVVVSGKNSTSEEESGKRYEAEESLLQAGL